MMEHKLCRSVHSAHVVLHDQGVLANAVLGALVRASDEAQLAEQVSARPASPLHRCTSCSASPDWGARSVMKTCSLQN